MPIIGALGIASRALAAFQQAITVTGQNIANVNTPGYSRQIANFSASTPVRLGPHILGTGTQILSVTRRLDLFLEAQLKREHSNVGYRREFSSALSRIEGEFGELSDTDLSSILDGFFGALEASSQNPEDIALRTQVIVKGQEFADAMRELRRGIDGVRADLNAQVEGEVAAANEIITEIAALNDQILRAEFGEGSPSTANDLRDRRDQLVRELSEKVKVTTSEQENGVLNVFITGEPVVFGTEKFLLSTRDAVSGGVTVQIPIFADNLSDVTLTGGTLKGLIEARDTNALNYIADLDAMVREFAFRFNQVHSGGRGLSAFSTITAVNGVVPSTTALAASDLAMAGELVIPGSFQIRVENSSTGQEDLVDIQIDSGETLASLEAKIEAVTGIDSSISTDGKLTIEANSANITFSFHNDTSGVLAALGINTFFTGSTSADIDINALVDGDASLLALAQSTAPGDNANALVLIAVRDEKLFNSGSTDLDAFYQGIVGTVGVDASQAQDLFEIAELTKNQVENQRDAVSGVNLDEELINLTSYQAAYNAAAQYTGVINELLDTLVNLV